MKIPFVPVSVGSNYVYKFSLTKSYGGFWINFNRIERVLKVFEKLKLINLGREM